MNLLELITILENKLVFLQNERTALVQYGDLANIAIIDDMIVKTNVTLSQLKQISI
jgi:hypothetical protein